MMSMKLEPGTGVAADPMGPRATSSQRVMLPKMSKSTALTLSSERISSMALVMASALEPAAGVEEVGWPAASLGDHVERRHDEPGAVTQNADVAVEFTYVRPRSFAIRSCSSSAETSRSSAMSGVAGERVAVDRDLGVEGQDLAALRHEQRIDLDKRRVVARRPRRACPASLPPAGSRRRRCPPRRPVAGRGTPGSRSADPRGACRIASGSVSATSSTSMPLMRESIAIGFLAERSNTIAA
jgi:hypothetical protein